MTIAHETDYDFETELARDDKVCGIPAALGLCLLVYAVLFGVYKLVMAVTA